MGKYTDFAVLKETS